MLAVILLARFHRRGQPVLPGREGTGGVRRKRTGRVVGPVEIQDDLAVQCRIADQEPPGRIGPVAGCAVPEDVKPGWVVDPA